MGCCDSGRNKGHVKEIHKWQYLNLADFKSSSCPTFFSYIWLWCLSLTSVAVYCVDTFTAYNLLAFNKWNSEIDPVVNFAITKWIFVGCILFSWVLCIYEWVRAIRVMKQESITEDYLDPLAVVVQSIKIPGGWRRFLVFAELTKSNKKATWVAIYVYFERKGALRILAAEGPRNVLNALAIYSVARADLIGVGGSKSDSSVGQFFRNIKTLFQIKQKEGIILASMTFTFVIWFFSMLMLTLALLLWLFYISHHVDKETLTGYCRRKIETKLSKIVKDKTDSVWAKEEAEREKQARKRGLDPEEDDKLAAIKRQPTLPVFDDEPAKSDGAYSTYSELVSTLPRYQSHTGTSADDELPPMPNQYSGQSSLLANTAPMGQSYPPTRPETAASNRTYGSQRGPYAPTMTTYDSFHSRNTSNTYRREESPPSAYGTSRRYSPPSGGNNGNGGPWRSIGPQYDEDAQEYEMHQTTPPGPARSYAGRDMTGPGGRSPPRKGSGGAEIPRSMTPGDSSTQTGNTMGGYGAGFPRSMTPGAPSMRSYTPGASSINSYNTGRTSPPRSTRTPGPGSMRSQAPSNRPALRSQTPGTRTDTYSREDEPRPGGSPGVAF